MTVETLLLALLIAVALWTARRHWRSIADLWAEARWWERALLLVALAPLPGPFEEIAGVVVARRVAVRARYRSPKKSPRR